MISSGFLFTALQQQGITFYTGVPDSLLKDFCAYITEHVSPEQNIIAANEGNAVALAAGYYLATGKTSLIYLQNSGLGNGINPLTSLTDPEVYAIPLLLLIGWRGEPGVNDEPQHIKMGRVTPKILESLEIPFRILPATPVEAENCLQEAVDSIKRRSAPYALLVKKGTFEPYPLPDQQYLRPSPPKTLFPLNREQVLRVLVPMLGPDDIVVSTTGKTSRELFELRRELGQGHEKDFLTVGCMGHASSIALGIALQKPERTVYCLDGDGAVIMHLGALATIGKAQPARLKHIIINNFAHDSVGGQPTAAAVMNIPAIALASGYKTALAARSEAEVMEAMEKIKKTTGPALLEIQCNKGARENLGRPTRTPRENKQDFMKGLRT
ncbi:MAG: phosphonopyruvate decarboxylase [Nanoarchaeota archaeon]